MRKNKGFTLIELVVVIVTVTLLALIILTKWPKRSTSARMIVCQMNQKKLVTAWKVYAADNDDKIVNGWPGNSETQMAWVDNPIDMSLQAKKEAIERGIWHRENMPIAATLSLMV